MEPDFILTTVNEGFIFKHPHQHWLLAVFMIYASLPILRWYLTIILIFIALISDDNTFNMPTGYLNVLFVEMFVHLSPLLSGY